MKQKIDDSVYINNWRELLKMFHAINPAEKGAEAKYRSLMELAKTKILTPRQMEGIIARCENCINGTYGKTKRAEHYTHDYKSKSFSENGKQK